MKNGAFYWIVTLVVLFSFPTNGFAQLLCGSGQFYAVGNATNGVLTAVYRLNNSGGTITIPNLSTPIIALPNNLQMSLAIADFGNGNKLYSHVKQGAVNKILRLDGSNWTVVYSDSTSDYTITNAGGKGPYLYFHASKTALWPSLIKRFTGSAMITIWQDTVASPVGDVAVDSIGNVYFFTGIGPNVNRLNILSPTGAIIDTIPVSFDASSAYGCFFDNDILYVAMGQNSTSFQNKMLPITITPGQATLGNPISIPNPVIGSTPNSTIRLNFKDFASCGSANIQLTNITTQSSNIDLNDVVHLFPVPASNTLEINWPGKGLSTLFVYDLNGKLIQQIKAENHHYQLSVEHFPNGIYLLEIISENKIARKKWIKN